MEKGFYQPIAYIIILAIAITYFATASDLYIRKVDAGQLGFDQVLKRERMQFITQLELYDTNGGELESKADFTGGLILRNEGENNAHIVAVYWVDADNGMQCVLERSNGSKQILELKRDRNVTMLPDYSAGEDCNGMDQSLDDGDYFIIQSIEKASVKYL